MSLHSSPARLKAFTLIELLVVIAIMAVLVSLTAMGIQGINNAGKFNKALSDISGILEQARAHAVAQDTYVWVALYENTPVNGLPPEVYVATFTSNDGTDPFDWTGSVALPSPGIYGTTTLSSLSRLYHFQGLHLKTTAILNAPTGSNVPAAAPVFQVTGQSDSGPVTLSGNSTVYGVIQFTPTGAAHNGPASVDSIWFGLQPALSPTVLDGHNIASMKVSGLTGLTTVYR